MHLPRIAYLSPSQVRSVLLLMYPEWSAILPTLPLAKSLQRQGARIVYGGIDPQCVGNDVYAAELLRMKAFVEREGFEYFHYESPPRHWVQSPDKLFRKIHRGVETLINELNVELVLVDRIFQFQGLAAVKCGVPAATLGTNVLSFANATNPPFTSSIMPGDEGFTSGKVRGAWMKRYLQTVLYDAGRGCVSRISRSVGIGCGFTEYGVRPRLPANMLYPRSLDFPNNDGKNYLGLQVDPSRREDAFVWDKMCDSKPLIYCSLGSQSYRYFKKTADTLLNVVVNAFRRRSDYQLVLHVGVEGSPDRFSGLPPWIRVLSWAPQLAILARAAAVITHGGMNTIQECIHSGVPMVVFPAVNDGPGNAARIVYHGLGRMGDPRQCSSEQLIALVDEVVGNPAYADNVARMRGEIMGADMSHQKEDRLRVLMQ